MLNETSVIILCGGKGTRLNDELLPKTLSRVNNKPILGHIIEFLSKQGVSDICLAIGFRGEKIVEYINHNYSNEKITFSDLGEDASMLHRIDSALNNSKANSLIIYGDTYIELNLQELINYHQKLNTVITLVSGKVQSPWGILKSNEAGLIQNFQEKPLVEYYIGCMIINNAQKPTLDKYLKDDVDSTGLVEWLQDSINFGKVGNYSYNGFKIDFNTQEELAKANAEFSRYYTLDSN